jgi:hypothetical protein
MDVRREMSQTAVSPQSAAQEQVEAGLSRFEEALAEANGEAAGALFPADSYLALQLKARL